MSVYCLLPLRSAPNFLCWSAFFSPDAFANCPSKLRQAHTKHNGFQNEALPDGAWNSLRTTLGRHHRSCSGNSGMARAKQELSVCCSPVSSFLQAYAATWLTTEGRVKGVQRNWGNPYQVVDATFNASLVYQNIVNWMDYQPKVTLKDTYCSLAAGVAGTILGTIGLACSYSKRERSIRLHIPGDHVSKPLSCAFEQTIALTSIGSSERGNLRRSPSSALSTSHWRS